MIKPWNTKPWNTTSQEKRNVDIQTPWMNYQWIVPSENIRNNHPKDCMLHYSMYRTFLRSSYRKGNDKVLKYLGK